MKRIVSIFLIASALVTSCKSSQTADLGDGIFADIQTTKGDIIVRLEYEKSPIAVANFVSLAEGKNPFVSDSLKGKKYYNGLIFHRVMKNFMIQGGDPLGTGIGGPGYRFANEINDSLVHDRRGIMSMANTGQPKSNGSQFFITHVPYPSLDGSYTVFGETLKGLDVIDTIANVKTDSRDKPLEDVVMNKIEIIRNGKQAKKFDAEAVMTKYFADEEIKEKEEAKLAAERAEKLKEIQGKFVADIIEQKKAAKTMPSGLKIFILKKGEGEKPKPEQAVTIFYEGYFEDGRLLDSNVEKIAMQYDQFNPNRKAQGGYEAMPMQYSMVGNLIAGFKEGVMQMKIGDKARLFIPSHLAYGEAGRGPIGPNTDLIFDIELVGYSE
tara:strand:+ start:6100 stop:7242 length:1143 start_codon:yes stop_codon:yes gene_type:complete